MKINAKYRMPLTAARQANFRNTTKDPFGIMDEDQLIALVFTRWASRRLPSAALFRTKHRSL
jgi:hypothetical protein